MLVFTSAVQSWLLIRPCWLLIRPCIKYTNVMFAPGWTMRCRFPSDGRVVGILWTLCHNRMYVKLVTYSPMYKVYECHVCAGLNNAMSVSQRWPRCRYLVDVASCTVCMWSWLLIRPCIKYTNAMFAPGWTMRCRFPSDGRVVGILWTLHHVL